MPHSSTKFLQYFKLSTFGITSSFEFGSSNVYKMIPSTQMFKYKFRFVTILLLFTLGFPHGSDSKESACSAGDWDWIPGSERSPEKGNGYPLWYSCLENSMDSGAWQAIVHKVTKSQT